MQMKAKQDDKDMILMDGFTLEESRCGTSVRLANLLLAYLITQERCQPPVDDPDSPPARCGAGLSGVGRRRGTWPIDALFLGRE